MTISITSAPAGVGLAGGLSRASTTITIRAHEEAPPVIEATASIADAEAEEGAAIEFTVSLSAAVGSDVTLDVDVIAGESDTATPADDLGPRRGQVTILEGETRATFMVPTIADEDIEEDETFTVEISAREATPLPEGVTISDDGGTATGTILNDDEPPVVGPPATVSIDDVEVAEDVSGGNAEFTVTLSEMQGSDVELEVTYASGSSNGATLASDLGTRTGSVTIPRGSLTATITVPIVDDDEAEEDETFTVTIALDEGAPSNVTVSEAVAQGTILNDDRDVGDVTVSIADAEATESDTMFFTVFLNRATDSTLIIDVNVPSSPGGRGEAADLLDLDPRRQQTVRINEGDTSAAWSVALVQDSESEGDETFTVTLSENSANPLPDGVEIEDREATGTILDDDGEGPNPAEITASIADATVAEDGGTASFTVFLNGTAGSDVTLDVAYAGSGSNPATPGDDLGSGRPATVTIAGRATSATLVVPIVDDEIDEEDETFTVTISGPPGGVAIGDGEATGEILDNFDTTAPPVAVSIAPVTVAEGDDAVFAATLSRAADSAVTLNVAVTAGSSNPATVSGAGADLGTLPPATATIPQGDTAVDITVPSVDDQDVEEDETFTVTLTATSLPDGVTIPGGAAAATGTITDDDVPPTIPTASIAPVTVAEDVSGGDAVFTVTLSAAADRAVTLDVAVAAGSTNPATVSGAGADLGTPPPATATIPRGSLTADITVPIVDDDIAGEGNETFTVTISDADSSLDGVVTISGGGTATGTITDDDAPPTPTVGIAPVTVAEDVSGGNAVFTVTLSAAADSAVTLDVAVTAGATNPVTLAGAGADLGTLPPATVTIPRGSLAADIPVPIVDDDIADEGNETFTVTISADSSLDGVVTISGGGTATGTITDDDAPDITVSVADAQASEGSGMITFRVTSSAPVPSEVRLSVSLEMSGDDPALVPSEDGTPADLTIPPGGILATIAANSTVGTFSVPIVDDDLEEMNETFTVELAPVPGGLPPGVVLPDEVEGPFGPRSVATATGTIIDDDSSGSNSVLAEAREAGAGTALRRHARRFDSLTGAVVRNRLDARATRRLSASENVGNGAAAAGGGLGETRWGAWIDGAWAGFDGEASGRQADVYGGVDYQAGDWLIGALIGYETADLDIGDATYRSDYTQLGVYGGARVSERLPFDGAATYGTATPDIAEGNVTASYDAHRLTVRGALTGDFGLEYGHGLKVQPRLGLLYSRERLDAFEDSAGGSVGGETLKLGRLSAGPRLTWEFDGGQVAGGVRAQWDFLQLDDGLGNRISGAADIGVNLDLTPNVTLGVQGDIDGIGTSGDFGSLGGRVKLDVRF